ncbi:hypothetical protein L1887_30254 [Cichorium endivia]|nr:hypothetical protein L1887_30254 [Cichorium endivia]
MATALSKAYKSPIVDTIESLPQHQHVSITKGCKTPKSEKSIISDNVAHHHDSATQPLFRELYQLNATNFFVPYFVNAFMANDNDRNQSKKYIMSGPVPGVYTLNMLQPHFYEMMLSEVETLEKWIVETKLSTMRPNTMNNYGVVLDDFGRLHSPYLKK